MHDCVVLTSHAGAYVPTLGFCPLPCYRPNWSRPCTLMGFMIATESTPRSRAYSSLQALIHFLERGVRLDRQALMLRLVGMLTLSALPLDSFRRNSARF